MISLTTKRATRFLFGTDALLPGDRLAIWLQDLGRDHMRLEIGPRETRTGEPLRSGDDGPAFSWVGRSDYRILDEDGTSPRDAGDGVLLLHGAADAFAMACRIQLTNIRLDGALFRSRIPDIDEQLLGRLPSNNIALRLLQAYVDALIASDIPADPMFAQTVNEHLVDLIAVALRPNDDPEPAAQGAVSAARLAAAKTDIRAHLCDPALSAKHVAQRLGLSERSIYLLFERSGLSFAPFVTDERLKLATIMLRDPARRQERIGDIALAAGFSDLSTFNRSFRRRYGRTPSSLRRAKPG